MHPKSKPPKYLKPYSDVISKFYKDFFTGSEERQKEVKETQILHRRKYKKELKELNEIMKREGKDKMFLYYCTKKVHKIQNS